MREQRLNMMMFEIKKRLENIEVPEYIKYIK